MPSINDLTAPLVSHVVSFLGPRDCCAFASAQKAWLAIASDDLIWERYMEDDFGVPTKQGLQPQAAFPTYMAAYGHRCRELGQYGPMAKRAILAWRTIEDWCMQHHPGILATLRPGASEAALDGVQQRLGRLLPPALRALYRIHDGQAYTASTPALHGLFGWFCVYGELHSTFMYPLSDLARACFPYKEHHLLFFASSVVAATSIAAESIWVDPRVRSICTELGTGRVRLVSRTRMVDAARVDAVSEDGEGLMRWFEAWAWALKSGYYQVKELEGPAEDMVHPRVRDEMRRRASPLLGISLIPRLPPGQVEAITRGVRVRASVVFQLDNPMPGGQGLLFAYSINMALLPAEQQRERWQGGDGSFRPLASAQLASRRWVMRNGAGEVESQVEGEGVIGEFPLLTAGGPAFEYQSCTKQQDLMGSMEGAFKFVEGSLTLPTGPSFDVQCPKFQLSFPEYQF